MPKTINELAIGDVVTVAVQNSQKIYIGDTVAFRIVDKNHPGYPTGSVTMIADKIILAYAIDGAEATNTDPYARAAGNERYLHSNIHQWLNSTAAAGQWYTPAHQYDAPPNSSTLVGGNPGYVARPGFLAMLEGGFSDALVPVEIKQAPSVAIQSRNDVITAKVYLPSMDELGGYMVDTTLEEGAEGRAFAGLSTLEMAACPTETLVLRNGGATDTFNKDTPWMWSLRTLEWNEGTRGVYYIGENGQLKGLRAPNGGYGLRPVCNVSGDTLVADSPDASGAYALILSVAPPTPAWVTVTCNGDGQTIYAGKTVAVTSAQVEDPDGDAVTYCFERSYNGGAWVQVQQTAARTFTETALDSWNSVQYRVRAQDVYGLTSDYATSANKEVHHNQPPVFDGEDAELGVKAQGFTASYLVTDPEGQPLDIVEKVDGTVTATKTEQPSPASGAAAVQGHTFTALSNGAHTLTITATDGAGNTAIRTLSFTKAATSLSVTLAQPLHAAQQPKRCNLVVRRRIPLGAQFKAEASNNPYDPQPVWETCTNAVLQGTAHVFENKINAAAQYGLNVRVTVERGEAAGECWISGIGGDFE